MIWRLLASILAVSDTGSIALNSEHHDWPTERSCMSAVQRLYSAPAPQSVNGHVITIKISASCQPVMP